jgi:homocysteine S-methyltransferase
MMMLTSKTISCGVNDPLASLQAINDGVVILDGGLATELEAKGHDLSVSPLWSARLIRDAPDDIESVHKAYLDAGADVISTATYQVM